MNNPGNSKPIKWCNFVNFSAVENAFCLQRGKYFGKHASCISVSSKYGYGLSQRTSAYLYLYIYIYYIYIYT